VTKKLKKPKPAAWGEQQVVKSLELTYCEPEYALLAQVRNRTGYGKTERYADALAFGLWPSRGLTVTGFEIKSSRSDWLRELKDPAKSVAIQKYCDFWYICAGREDIVLVDELPVTWGLMVPAKTKMKVVVKAPQLKDWEQPTRSFMASVMRRVLEQKSDKAEAKRSREEGYSAGFDAGEKVKKSNRTYKQQRAAELQVKVDEFQKASGIDIMHAWHLGKVGEAVKLLSGANAAEQVARNVKILEQGAEELRKVLEKLDVKDET